jgi:O-antigen/teichoic acid export membrane protein
MVTLTFIGFFDRFFIKGNFGAELFGNYFYLTTIFYFPFSLLQGYIGFKELVHFKTNASLSLLKNKLFRINLLSLLLGGCLLVIAILLDHFTIIPSINFMESWVLILILLILGILRINYSMLSSVLGAIGSISIIKKANFQSLFFIVLLLVVGYSFLNTIEAVAGIVLLIWMSRIYIWYKSAMQQLKNTEL